MKGFEDRLNKLEEITEKIQEGNIPLEDAVALFEDGVKLAKSLEKDLNKVERKIEILLNQPDKPEEEPALELFPELNDQNDQNGRDQ